MIIEDPVLILAAHPDDEVLGCGGTIAKLTDNGYQVTVVIFGKGITARYDQPEQADENLLREHQSRAQKACDMLGVSNLTLLDYPDNRFDTVPLLDLIKSIEEIIEKEQPSTIFTHHGGDLNIDHVLLNRATLTAARPHVFSFIKDIFTFEIPSSSDWTFNQFSPSFQPFLYTDIEKYMERKIEAMEVYESERRDPPHPRSPEKLRALASMRGAQSGMMFAEAFASFRSKLLTAVR